MKNINSAFSDYDDSVEKSKTSYSGLLGLAINGNKIVNHPTRAGYVYVRLRDNLSEVVQAFNDKVSPVYDFPVLIQRKGNRWYVLGRDDLRYESWGTSAPYLPRHGDQHSFNRDGGGGGDVTWVYPDQFMPLLVYPSGTYGGSNLLIAPYILQKSDRFMYVGNTGTSNLLPYKPTNSNAIMGLVYLDKDTGNPGVLIGSGTPFAGSITGTNAIVPYLPFPSASQEPLYAFRLVSGTTALTWDNLYNVRQFIGGSTATGTSGVSDHESLPGLLGGSANNHYHLTPSQVIGLVSGTSTALHSHAGGGSPGGSNTEIQYNNSGTFGGDPSLIWDATYEAIQIGGTNWYSALLYGGIHITKEAGGNFVPMIVGHSYGDGTGDFTNVPTMGADRAGGTVATPTAVLDNMGLVRFNGGGYDGTALSGTRAQMLLAAAGNWSATSHPTKVEFWTTPVSSVTRRVVGTLGEDGNFNILTGKTYNVNGSPHTHIGLVTNGDSHDHNGGDGAQITHTSLSSIGTNTHAQIDTHLASTANPHGTSDANLGVTDVTTNNASTTKHGFLLKATAPAANELSVVGIANGETAYTLKGLFNATAPMDGAVTATAGSSVQASRSDHVHSGRELLTAARTYYVRTDGSNSNTGLANTSGGAFLTVQKAIDTLYSLDLGIYNVTIQIADGSYTGTVTVTSAFLGMGSVTIQGNSVTPTNVVLTASGTDTVSVSGGGAKLIVKDFKVLSPNAPGRGLYAENGGSITFQNINFGACTGSHIMATGGGVIAASGNYSISGASARHWFATGGGSIVIVSLTITITGTPAFSSAFAVGALIGVVTCYSNTFSGSATGTRYSASANGVVYALAGATYLPGNVAGGVLTGGQYV